MVLVYTLEWKCIDFKRSRLSIRIKAITSDGQIVYFDKYTIDWIGVFTNDIEAEIKRLTTYLPNIKYRYEHVCRCHNLFPMLFDRLKTTGQLAVSTGHFYKIYLSESVEDVGHFLKCPHFSYYSKNDWLIRLSIDLWQKFNISFYHRWYDINADNEKRLLESISEVVHHQHHHPSFKIAAFDLETVPLEKGEKRVPTGYHPNDRIVIISVVIGTIQSNGRIVFGDETYCLYLELSAPSKQLEDYIHVESFPTEKQLIRRFLQLIQPDEIVMLTGYNINRFDIPCLLSRMAYIFSSSALHSVFQSKSIDGNIVVNIFGKYSIDAYMYYTTYAPHGLPNFKLDTIAQTKLNEGKLPLDIFAIHQWYRGEVTDDTAPFHICLHYCVIDSELVLKLINQETMLGFLFARANDLGFDLERSLYSGSNSSIVNWMKSYSMFMGYFINFNLFTNVTRCEDETGRLHPFKTLCTYSGSKLYQGALNYCTKPGIFQDVSVLDYESLYPSVIRSHNISYETFALVHIGFYNALSDEIKSKLTAVPYRCHTENDIVTLPLTIGVEFSFPEIDSGDSLIMISMKDEIGLLNSLLSVLIQRRQKYKELIKNGHNGATNDNKQRAVKLLANSIYGLLGSETSVLGCMALGMSITCFARYLLIGAYHYVSKHGYFVPYCDTDSLFIERYSSLLNINEYLNRPHINLQFETCYPLVCFLSKKKYVVTDERGQIKTKGFEVKGNAVVKTVLNRLIYYIFKQYDQPRPRKRDEHKERKLDKGKKKATLFCTQVTTLDKFFYKIPPKKVVFHTSQDDDWHIVIELLMYVVYRSCVNTWEIATSRKIKALNDYSPNCTSPHVRLMRQQNLSFQRGDVISYVYTLSDVGQSYPNFVQNYTIQTIDFEKILVNQKRNILHLLNIGLFRELSMKEIEAIYKDIINIIKWKRFVNLEIKCYHKTKRRFVFMVDTDCFFFKKFL